MESFVVYCDESSHTNLPDRKYLAIGSLWIPRATRDSISKTLKAIKRENEINGEVKWHKVSDKVWQHYAKLIDFFFEHDELRFRIIIVDQERVGYGAYHNSDPELGFYKFYYHMLHQWIEAGNEYLILLDFKNNKGANRFSELKSVLVNKFRGVSHIRDLTVVDSHQSHLMQLCDLLTGAVAADFNSDIRPASAKRLLASYIASRLGWDNLAVSTSREMQKFNIFKINLSLDGDRS